MTYHLPPVMVAIGLLADEADRNCDHSVESPRAVATGVPALLQAETEMLRFSVGDPCERKSAQIYHRSK
jgi:hypothetical protein